MSHSLFAFPYLNAQTVLSDEKVFETYNSAPLLVRQHGGLRFTIFSSAAVKATVHITPENGTLASGVLNGDTDLIAGGVSGFVLDVPRGATFDLSFSGTTTVTIFAAHVLGAVA